jgi:MFS family permease
MPYLSSVGLSRIGAGLVATTLPIVSAGSRLVSGWLSDRFNKKLVTLFFFAAMFFGIVPMLWISEKNIWLLIPFVFFFGLAWGGNATLRVTMMGQHFERSHFGSIFG